MNPLAPGAVQTTRIHTEPVLQNGAMAVWCFASGNQFQDLLGDPINSRRDDNGLAGFREVGGLQGAGLQYPRKRKEDGRLARIVLPNKRSEGFHPAWRRDGRPAGP